MENGFSKVVETGNLISLFSDSGSDLPPVYMVSHDHLNAWQCGLYLLVFRTGSVDGYQNIILKIFKY